MPRVQVGTVQPLASVGAVFQPVSDCRVLPFCIIQNGCTEMGNCVIVLDDMTLDNGCLFYVPGSHHDASGVCSVDALRTHKDGVVGFSRALEQWSSEDEATEVPMLAKRGDVIVHHCLVVHRAGVNTTTESHRRTLGFSYQVSSAITACRRVS